MEQRIHALSIKIKRGSRFTLKTTTKLKHPISFIHSTHLNRVKLDYLAYKQSKIQSNKDNDAILLTDNLQTMSTESSLVTQQQMNTVEINMPSEAGSQDSILPSPIKHHKETVDINAMVSKEDSFETCPLASSNEEEIVTDKLLDHDPAVHTKVIDIHESHPYNEHYSVVYDATSIVNETEPIIKEEEVAIIESGSNLLNCDVELVMKNNVVEETCELSPQITASIQDEEDNESQAILPDIQVITT